MKTQYQIGHLLIENHDSYKNYFNGNGGDKVYWLEKTSDTRHKTEISKTDPRILKELRKYGIHEGRDPARFKISPLWGLRLGRLERIAANYPLDSQEPAIYLEAEPTRDPSLNTNLFPVKISVDNIDPRSPEPDAIHYHLPPRELRRSILGAEVTVRIIAEGDVEVYHAHTGFNRNTRGSSIHFSMIALPQGNYRVEANVVVDYIDVHGRKAHEENSSSQSFWYP